MRLLRNLIIISVLLVSVTVQASGVDELVRIKQNYARMLVPSGKDPFGLLSILSSIQPMYWDEWPVAHPFLIFGALQTHNKNWQSTWEKLEHFPVTDEVVRNLPVRNPLIWI